MEHPELEREGINPLVRSKKVVALQYFYDGFIGARYSVNATTNVNGLEIPIAVRLERYKLVGKGTEEGKTLFEVSELNATRVFSPATMSCSLIRTQTVWIGDYRVKSNDDRLDYVSYPLAVDGALPTLAELRPALAEKLRLRPARKLSMKDKNKTVVILFMTALLVCLPIGLLIMQRRKRI